MHAPAPWLGHYDDGVPATLAPYPDRTLTDYLGDAARERPDSPAIYFKGRDPFLRRSRRPQRRRRRGAGGAIGVRAGDRVAFSSPNCPQFVIVQFAVWKLGGIVAPINPTYSESRAEARCASTASKPSSR